MEYPVSVQITGIICGTIAFVYVVEKITSIFKDDDK